MSSESIALHIENLEREFKNKYGEMSIVLKFNRHYCIFTKLLDYLGKLFWSMVKVHIIWTNKWRNQGITAPAGRYDQLFPRFVTRLSSAASIMLWWPLSRRKVFRCIWVIPRNILDTLMKKIFGRICLETKLVIQIFAYCAFKQRNPQL
jgi:hypothetical protein